MKGNGGWEERVGEGVRVVSKRRGEECYFIGASLFKAYGSIHQQN